MNYSTFVAQILSDGSGATPSTADMLWYIDAHNKSVPTLEEFNAALMENQQPPVTSAEYESAVAKNHERMLEFLESKGTSREQVQEILQNHDAIWKGRG